LSTIKIGNKTVGDGHPAFIIAEMAWSHDGKAENARRIIDAAVEAKADAVCFHITSMEDYMVPHYKTGKGRVSAGKETRPIYEYLAEINLKEKDWAELFPYSKKKGLLMCTMCNDPPSVKLAAKLGTDAYVISPAALAEEDLVKETAKNGKAVLLRIGGALMEEVERVIRWIKQAGNEDIALIYGFQNYPTRLEDANLRFVPTLKKKFSLPIGYADHTDGASEIALIAPLLSLPFGANLIEAHLTYDRSLKGEDFESALDPKDFKRFVQNIREIEKTFGSDKVRPLSEEELKYRENVRKRAVASRDIKKGEAITRDKIAFKRSDEGIFPDEIGRVIGKKAAVDIKKNEPIVLDSLKKDA